jgi:hypothetical protein
VTDVSANSPAQSIQLAGICQVVIFCPDDHAFEPQFSCGAQARDATQSVQKGKIQGEKPSQVPLADIHEVECQEENARLMARSGGRAF